MGNIRSPRGARFPSDCRRHRACTLCAKHTLLVSCDVAEKKYHNNKCLYIPIAIPQAPVDTTAALPERFDL